MLSKDLEIFLTTTPALYYKWDFSNYFLARQMTVMLAIFWACLRVLGTLRGCSLKTVSAARVLVVGDISRRLKSKGRLALT